LRLMAQSIDGRYWEQEEETRRERNSQPSEKKPDKSSNQQSSSNNSKKDSKNNSKKNQSSNQGGSSSNSEKKNPDLSDKLGKDGKLTQAERTRRFNNNLCLFCGGMRHTAKECPKSSSSATKAKARAVQTKSDSAPVAEDTKKSLSSLLDSTRAKGCVEPHRATEEFRLNTSTPFQSNVLFLLVTTSTITTTFKALVDSGSTHCFVDPRFIANNKLITYAVPPIPLKLIDGTINNIITEANELQIRIIAGHVTPFTFYVTPLDSSCSIVLGYNWLTHYNPLIDWVLSSIIFPANRVENPISEPTSLHATVSEELETTDTTKPHDYHSDFHDSESHDSKSYEPNTPASMNPPNYAKIDITLVNAVAYQCACQLPGSQSFSITLSNGETSARLASASAEKPIDLTGVPEEYHDFADVFSEVKANKLPPHRPYNLQINIEEGSTPPLGLIYLLLKTELEALREFLDENIANGFIRPTRSPYGAPILFVKKKGG